MFKFNINLQNTELFDIYDKVHGPLFHRWLPNGKSDSLTIQSDSSSTLDFWFERFGYVPNKGLGSGFLKFDYNKREVDPDIVSRQAVIDGGPLFGMLEINNISQCEFDAITNKKTGDNNYKKIGKHIVNNVIAPNVKKIIDTLKLTYGQYWIQHLPNWDSRTYSLGNYCYTFLSLKWSQDKGETWHNFVPDNSNAIHINVESGSNVGEEYITPKDWKDINDILQEDHQPSFAAHVLNKAYILKDRNEIKYAFIEATTALELAIEEFIEKKLNHNERLLKQINGIWNLSMPAKATLIGGMIDNVSTEEIQDTIKGIEIRNEITHEAKPLPKDAEKKLETMINTIAKIIGPPIMKFPGLNTGNTLTAVNKNIIT